MRTDQLPASLVRSSQAGDCYVPSEGPHQGHVLHLVSTDSAERNIVGAPLRRWLIRCEACLTSFTCPPEDGTHDV